MNDLQFILDEIKRISTEIFGENQCGLYVHGSLAFGCFRWEKSDIDYLAVVKRPPTLREKVDYISTVLELNKLAPPKGIEMSVVLEEHCRQFVYPTPYALHFSNAHLQRAEADTAAYCEYMQGVDPDLAAHFTVTRAVGKALFGPPAEEMFSPVPAVDYLESIRYDVENAAEDILENPMYVVLNLCRSLAYAREGAVISKAQGGAWGLQHLPEEHLPIVQAALECYTADVPFPLDAYKNELPAFAQTMLLGIFGA